MTSIAMPWNSKSPGVTRPVCAASMVDLGCDVLESDVLESGVTPSGAKNELLRLAQKHQNYKGDLKKEVGKRHPLLEELLAPGPELKSCVKLKAFAKEGMAGASGLLLPGGHDIAPWVYGQNLKKYGGKADFNGINSRRTILELHMLNQAVLKGIPVLGICRGSQIINVFFGGSLVQNVGGHFVKDGAIKVKMTQNAKNSFLAEAMQKDAGTFKAHSFHHQASNYKDIGPFLTVTAQNGNVVKAMEGVAGAPIIALQIHPEMYNYHLKPTPELKWLKPKQDLMDKGNLRILQIFVKAAQAVETRIKFFSQGALAMKKNKPSQVAKSEDALEAGSFLPE